MIHDIRETRIENENSAESESVQNQDDITEINENDPDGDLV